MRSFPIYLTISSAALLIAMISCKGGSSAGSSAGTRLALSEPSNQSMAQGESKKVAIHIERTGFADPVRITFANLPSGVRVESDTILAGDSSREFVFVASPTAAVVDKQIITVTAKGSSISTSQTFEISVKSKA